MDENTTKYRIVTKDSLLGKQRFLQFYHNGWRYVPEQLNAYVHGIYLSANDCPKNLLMHDNFNFKRSEIDDEKVFLISFTKTYLNIDNYFKHINKLRLEYLEDNKLREAKRLPDTFYIN